jgi:hypothetical protein
VNSPLEKFDRLGEASGRLRQQPQKIEPIGISRLRFQDPSQDRLGVRHAARALMFRGGLQ